MSEVLKITTPDFRRKLLATKSNPVVEGRTIQEEEQEVKLTRTKEEEVMLTRTKKEEPLTDPGMVEREDDPVLSRRRRPNVVLREGYRVVPHHTRISNFTIV